MAKEKDVKKMKVKEVNAPEKVFLLQKVRVKEHGETNADAYKAGDVVTVSGKDKYELLNRGIAEIYDPKVHDKKG